MFKNLDISISKISYSKNTISKRESFIMKYTEQKLKDKTYAILRSNPLNLYTDKIVVEDKKCIGRKEYLTSDTKKSFKEVIVSVLEEYNQNNSRWTLGIDENKECTYNKFPQRIDGLRKKQLDSLYDEYIEQGKKEDRLVHCMCHSRRSDGLYKDGFATIDYQITTKNAGKENIDLFLKDEQYYYMTEVKYFNSIESLLRCVLEIETYYEKLNPRFFELYSLTPDKLKKAVLVDAESLAYKEKDLPWAKKLIEKFDIVMLELIKEGEEFIIKKI